jgi:hypothetical protein
MVLMRWGWFPVQTLPDGSPNDDMLIGGYPSIDTQFDGNGVANKNTARTASKLISAEWISDDDYDGCIADLQGAATGPQATRRRVERLDATVRRADNRAARSDGPDCKRRYGSIMLLTEVIHAASRDSEH